MVNAAMDIPYGKDFYKKGTKLPAHLVELFEIANPSLLDNYIEINSVWVKIEDKNISGFVRDNKKRIKRLKEYFKIKPEIPKEEPEPTKMLKVKKEKPKPKYTGLTFKVLNRKQQEKELTKLGISFSKKDKERALIRKYLKNV